MAATPSSPRAALRRDLLLDRSGAFSVELALVTTVLVLLALGGLDLGRLALEQMRVVSAARAGAQYATQDDSTAGDTARIVEAVRRDADDLDAQDLTVATRSFCACADVGEASCGQPCPDGSYPSRHAEVSVSSTLELLFPYPGIEPPSELRAASTMRLR